MGLDITAYSHQVVAAIVPEYDEMWHDGGYHLEPINHHFLHAVPKEYQAADYVAFLDLPNAQEHSFRAGSYGGYNAFRRTLGMGTEVLAVWADPAGHADTPFVELINFSDCEGVMFGPVCQKLYNDFVQNRDAYVDYLISTGHDDYESRYYVERYEDWTEAFRLASQNGMVSFH